MTSRRNRTHLQIVSEILATCIKPQSKTHLMYGSSLSYKMLTHYLSEAQEAGLLEASAYSEVKYVTTKKGLEYLKKYRELQEIADLSAHE